MKPGCVLFDGAEQLFRKWEEPTHTVAERKIYLYHTLILALLADVLPRFYYKCYSFPYYYTTGISEIIK